MTLTLLLLLLMMRVDLLWIAKQHACLWWHHGGSRIGLDIRKGWILIDARS